MARSAQPDAFNPQPFLAWLADLIRQSGRPEVADVTVTETWAIAVRYGDGAGSFVKVCHLAPAGALTPERPSWPGPNALPAKPDARPASRIASSMRASYFAGWLQHLIQQQWKPTIVALTPFAEVGAVGDHWPRYGLKVTLRGGDAVYLSVVGTSPDAGHNPDLPEHFEPTEEHRHPAGEGE